MPRKQTTARRLAKTSGLEPEDLVLLLLEADLDVSSADATLEGEDLKRARAVVKTALHPPPERTRDSRTDGDGPASPTDRREPIPLTAAPGGFLETLTCDDVLSIHRSLVADFAITHDPIDPPGVRSEALLESAVARQHTGWGDKLKYGDPIANAATLLFGLCNDHPFHNGNKRTALVAMLAHLDKNRLVLREVKERELLRFVVDVANHSVVEERARRGRTRTLTKRRGSGDEEVSAITNWLAPRTEKIRRGERRITYRELRRTLEAFGYVMANPKNMKIGIYRRESRLTLRGRRPILKQVMSIDSPGENRIVAVRTIKWIRRSLNLREEDGVDSETFYGRGIPVDRFINQYRVILRKLSDR